MGGRRWTTTEDAILRREWGELGARSLRQILPGRTACAAALRGRVLGLPPQGQGRDSVSSAAVALGLDYGQVRDLARDAGMRLDPLVPVPVARRAHPKREADAEALAEILRQRDGRTQTARAWDRAHGASHDTSRRRLARAGLSVGVTQGQHGRVPEGLLAEVERGERGPWCDLWRRALATDPRPCAPWLLALAAWDLRAVAEGRAPREAAEWVGLWLPCAVRAAARQLAGVAAVRPARAGAAADEECAA